MSMRKQWVTKGELIADLRRVARLLGRSPSSPEYCWHGRYNEKTYRVKFGGSWAEIVARAGLLYTPRYCYRVPSLEELKRDLARVTRELGQPPEPQAVPGAREVRGNREAQGGRA